jgi:hypothetical protein
MLDLLMGEWLEHCWVYRLDYAKVYLKAYVLATQRAKKMVLRRESQRVE